MIDMIKMLYCPVILDKIRPTVHYIVKQEARLMLTNPCDAFRGQSKSPNIVPFPMLGIVYSCAIVTLLLLLVTIFNFKRCRE